MRVGASTALTVSALLGMSAGETIEFERLNTFRELKYCGEKLVDPLRWRSDTFYDSSHLETDPAVNGLRVGGHSLSFVAERVDTRSDGV
jgi:hypothetical protein